MGFACKESDIVRACLVWLEYQGILAWRSNNTGVFDPSRNVFRTFRGLKGVSDILGIFPQTVVLGDGSEVTFGNLLAVEVKRPGEEPRPEQQTFLQAVRDRGGIAICAHSVQELEKLLRPFR